MVEEVEKKYRKINIIFNKKKINNKTIKSKNKIIPHTSDIKDKNIKMINLTNRYIRKRVKMIKSVNKNNITYNKNERWTEEFKENVYINNLKMIEKIDGLVGVSPWILKDFRSPRRLLNGIQDYYNRKGLISDNGDKKKAFYILKNWYEKIKEKRNFRTKC